MRQSVRVLKRRKDEEWVRVGGLTVESGTCLVVDPTYHRDGFYGVDEVGAAVIAAVGSPSSAAPLLTSDGLEIGTVSSTGFGDDVYPVEVRYVNDERGTRRVAELRVVFIDA
jgi:hypothetical protein